MTQHQFTAARFRAKCDPHCSVLLCKTCLHQAVQHCTHTYGDLLFIQVSSDPAPMHCSRAQGKTQLHCLVLLCKTCSQQAMCHCIHTYGDLLLTQVCSDPAPMICSKDKGKMQSPLFSAALQNMLAPGSATLHSHLWRFALHTGEE